MRLSITLHRSGGPMEGASRSRLWLPPSRARPPDSVRRHRAVWWGGMLASALVHLLAFLLLPGATIVLERLGGNDAVPALDPDPIVLVRLAVPAEGALPEVSTPPVLARRPVVAVREIAGSRPAPDLTRAPPLRGRLGVAFPTRAVASGPSAAEAERYVQPVARDILPDWRPSRSFDGLVVTARVHLDAAGEPTGPVKLLPVPGNRRLSREITLRVRGLEYQPARRNGEPVAAWAEITFVFCHRGVAASSPAPRELPQDPCNPNKSKELGSH